MPFDLFPSGLEIAVEEFAVFVESGVALGYAFHAYKLGQKCAIDERQRDAGVKCFLDAAGGAENFSKGSDPNGTISFQNSRFKIIHARACSFTENREDPLFLSNRKRHDVFLEPLFPLSRPEATSICYDLVKMTEFPCLYHFYVPRQESA